MTGKDIGNLFVKHCGMAYYTHTITSLSGIIKEGGVQPNVIPDSSELKFWLRAPDHTDLHHIKQKSTACFVAAAKVNTKCYITFI